MEAIGLSAQSISRGYILNELYKILTFLILYNNRHFKNFCSFSLSNDILFCAALPHKTANSITKGEYIWKNPKAKS